MRILKFQNSYKLLIIFLMAFLSSCDTSVKSGSETGTFPSIFPDYQFVTIPCNISPLNFKIEDFKGKINVEFKNGQYSLLTGGKGKIDIPIKKWRRLLENSKGDSISVTVAIKENGKWNKFKPFQIYVSDEQIDTHLTFRLVAPGYENWSKMGIYQRNLTNFKQKAVIENTLIPGSCVNCHSFCQNDAGSMMFHLRTPEGGTFIIKDDQIKKIDMKSDKTIANTVYPYWHPSGNYIAFSVNKISQAFHSVKEKRIEVIDSESDVVVYDIRNNKLILSDKLSGTSHFETFPTFSPDGKYLYFTSAESKPIPSQYDQIRYNLNRISFNPDNGTFGSKVETVINADTIGKTISFPRISPDGKFLIFTMANYGNFTIWHKEADLYLLDLKKHQISPMKGINSDETESYHSWSSNSRWIIFSSRRIDGLYTHPYIAFIDESGKTGKPFLLPQKDPDYYKFLLQSFNIPEFITSEVKVDALDIEKITKRTKSIKTQ